MYFQKATPGCASLTQGNKHTKWKTQDPGTSTQRRERRIPLLTEEIVTEQPCSWSKEQPVQTESG